MYNVKPDTSHGGGGGDRDVVGRVFLPVVGGGGGAPGAVGVTESCRGTERERQQLLGTLARFSKAPKYVRTSN